MCKDSNKREGKGTMSWKDSGITFEGSWREDKANGQGRMLFNDGSVYEGDWVNGQREG